MRHYFLDTNVVIDFLTRRGTFAAPAAQLFAAAVTGHATLYVAALSFSNTYYALRKENTPEERIDKLTKLARLVQVIAVDATVV